MVTAIHYGADAVYMGGKQFSLRAKAGNFSGEKMTEAVKYAHNHGVKVYVTINILAHNRDFSGLDDYLCKLRKANVDGLIISDPGILRRARKCVPDIPVHLSTQANVTKKQLGSVPCSTLNHERISNVKRGKLLHDLYGTITGLPIRQRPGRREPRCLKRRPKNYQLLTLPRHKMEEMKHRSRYRAATA